jgi:IS605 OrfB family transposase
MTKKQKTVTTEETFTQVIPVVFCSDSVAIDHLMNLAGTVKAQTYNKFGSLTGWGISPMSSPDKIIRNLHGMTGFDNAKKLHEWQCLDTIKAIRAQQQAAKTYISRAIWKKHPLTENEKLRRAWLNANKKDEKSTKVEVETSFEAFPRCAVQIERERLLDLMQTNPTADKWLHRIFRKEYQRGHTYQRNQMVYQGAGYSCKRLTRNTVLIVLNGIARKEKIQVKLKCRHIISGQIRLIKNDQGNVEVHCTRKRTIKLVKATPTLQIGVDKGYTEAFFTSNGEEIGKGLGKLMTTKTSRITRANRNRYRIRAYAAALPPEKQAAILENNLGYKVKSRKLTREKATIKSFIRSDLRKMVTEPAVIWAEDLTQPIRGKRQATAINRKLNQWMKGELQKSLEVIAKETGSIVKTVNPAYTSQLDRQTGTLLGSRCGDRFIRITGDVEQADKNAALNILDRGHDTEITRYMRSEEVRAILLERTVRYLASIDKSVSRAFELGWLHSKFKAEAIRLEARLSPQGV